MNGTAPEPVGQATFARVLGSVLGRPAFLPAPSLAIRLALGEMGQALVLEGQYVRPTRLLEHGFRFDEPALAGALEHCLGLRS